MQHTVPYTPQENGVARKLDRHKAHLVAKGFSQVEGIYYTETFSPLAKINSIPLFLSLATSFKWEVHQMGVKSAFLHGDLHEKIYMEQPPGFIQKESNLVFHLRKSLYGVKQAPQAWYVKMDRFLLDMVFLGVILTTLSTPRRWVIPSPSLFFILMILSSLVVIQII